VAHVSLANLLVTLVGKKLGNFLGRKGYNGLGCSQDYELAR
jgi:hypothetical protein